MTLFFSKYHVHRISIAGVAQQTRLRSLKNRRYSKTVSKIKVFHSCTPDKQHIKTYFLSYSSAPTFTLSKNGRLSHNIFLWKEKEDNSH